MLSVHICVELMSILCSLRMSFARRVPKTAACFSNLVFCVVLEEPLELFLEQWRC